jgi:hypothetical protein
VQDKAKDALNHQRGRGQIRRIDSHGQQSLKGLPNLAPPTRERVLQAARDLSHSIDPSTSRLAAGRTTTLGTVMLPADQWFYSKVSTAAEGSLIGRGYDLVRYGRASLANQAELFKWQLPGRHVDGLTCFTVVGAVHTAACGAVWQMLVKGFARSEITEAGTGVEPGLPKQWGGLTFELVVWYTLLEVKITPHQDTITADSAVKKPSRSQSAIKSTW